ncbi:MAG TPA: hypothetical protein VGM62_01045 [Chthoniobacterales bacterium]
MLSFERPTTKRDLPCESALAWKLAYGRTHGSDVSFKKRRFVFAPGTRSIIASKKLPSLGGCNFELNALAAATPIANIVRIFANDLVGRLAGNVKLRVSQVIPNQFSCFDISTARIRGLRNLIVLSVDRQNNLMRLNKGYAPGLSEYVALDMQSPITFL